MQRGCGGTIINKKDKDLNMIYILCMYGEVSNIDLTSRTVGTIERNVMKQVRQPTKLFDTKILLRPLETK